MSTALQTLVTAADKLLEPQRFNDYCPNGLQVEGRSQVRRLVSGVTASEALIEAAVAVEADALFVHHGYFWRGEAPQLVGMKRRRIALLLQHDISLLAYHLPLDAHPRYGNNAQLALMLDLQTDGPLVADDPSTPGSVGRLAEPITAAAFAVKLSERLGRVPLHIGDGDAMVHTVAWCTGAAQSLAERALAHGVDAYLSGEVSEQTVHLARESGMHFYAAGHHATERGGARAVGDYLADALGIEHQNIDIDNPV